MNRSKLEDAINLSHLEKLKQKFKVFGNLALTQDEY